MTRRSKNEDEPVHALLATASPTERLRQIRDQTREKWSVKDLGEQFHISRDYMKKLLRKRNPVRPSKKIVKRIPEVLKMIEPLGLVTHRAIILYSKWRIESDTAIYIRPRRCRGHNAPAIMSPNQVYCGTNKKQRAACLKLWRRRQRQRERRGRKEKDNGS